MPLHEAHIQMRFCPETPKWESQNSQSWDFCDSLAHNKKWAQTILIVGTKSECQTLNGISSSGKCTHMCSNKELGSIMNLFVIATIKKMNTKP
jgi:hypothetical protein